MSVDFLKFYYKILVAHSIATTKKTEYDPFYYSIMWIVDIKQRKITRILKTISASSKLLVGFRKLDFVPNHLCQLGADGWYTKATCQ